MQLMSLPKRKERKSWKVCIKSPFQNCSKIYPIQQQKVFQIVEHLKKNTNVKRVIIFWVKCDRAMSYRQRCGYLC